MDYKIPDNASIPPKVGEYGYFLPKYFDNNGDKNNRNLVYYCIKVVNHPKLVVPCHYSLKEFFGHRPYRVSWGEIIDNMTGNDIVEGKDYNDFNYR
jgi:hypothetical protein